MNITKLTLTEINILQVVLTKIGWFRSQIKFDHNAVRALTKKLDANKLDTLKNE